MLNDPLANALSTILNAEKVGKDICNIKPISKVIKRVLEIMQEKMYIGSYEELEDGRGNMITINLIGKINKCGVIKPSFPVKKDNFQKYEKRYLPAKEFGMIIISTSKGVMTLDEAVKKGVGGKLLAYCY